MTDRDGGPAWGRIFDARTPRDEVDRAIAEWVAYALSELAMQLEADPDFTRQQCAAIIARAEPLIHSHTQRTFVQAWERLRAEAGRLDADATTVH